MSVATGFQRALKILKQKLSAIKISIFSLIFARNYFKVKVTPVEALWQQPLVVESKESREPENDDDEADGDDDDDDVVRLFDNSSGTFAFVAGQSARGAQVFRVLRRAGGWRRS